MRVARALWGLLLPVALGCSGAPTAPPDAAPPKYSPMAISETALKHFDKNANGAIEGAELNACPALKHALAAIDTNGDKQLTGEELTKRAELYAESSTGSVRTSCSVQLDGMPLAGAVVTFTPEACMGGGFSPATAKTDADGRFTTFTVDGTTYPGLAAGLYRIAVVKDGVRIPAKFNTETILGREVVENVRAAEVSIELSLTSK